MARISILVVVALALSAPAESQRRGAIIQGRGRGVARSTQTVHLVFQGMDRTYLLHMPVRTSSAPAPLVLAFHGGSQTADQMEEMSGFSELADREGFVVAY